MEWGRRGRKLLTEYRIIHDDILKFAAKYDGPLFHALLCDPPYHLTTITKRFGKEGSAPAKFGTDGVYQRASTGFLGQKWDGGDIAFRPETWRALGKLLYPGAFGMAFAGTRGYHRMAVALEDAGYILHPVICWLFSSGFPKATRIDSQIDRNAPREGMFENFAKHFGERWGMSGKGYNRLFEHFPHYKNAESIGAQFRNWRLGKSVPTMLDYKILQSMFDLSDEFLPLIERIEAERKVIGRANDGAGNTGNETVKFMAPDSKDYDITESATDLARAWEGHRYGRQALKPALEMICVFQKPYEGRPIDSITETGAGALNIEKGRVGFISTALVSAHDGKHSSLRDIREFCDKYSVYAQPLFYSFCNKQSGVEPCSNYDKSLLRNEVGLDGSQLVDVLYDYKNLDFLSSDSGYVQRKNKAQDFLVDYPACSRLYDELIQRIQEDDQDVFPSQGDALSYIYMELFESLHNPDLDSAHLSIEDALFLFLTFSFVLSGALNIGHSIPSKTQKSTGRWPANIALSHSPDCQLVGYQDADNYPINRFTDGAKPFGDGAGHEYETEIIEAGQLPVHECVEECAVRALDEQTGTLKSGKFSGHHKINSEWGYAGGKRDEKPGSQTYGDSGGASRFFYNADWMYERLEETEPFKYQAKAAVAEKEAGLINHLPCKKCGGIDSTHHKNENGEDVECKRFYHPTAKPIALIKWLASLLLPPDEYAPRRILIPFCGTSSEMVGAFQAGWDDITGVELEEEYVEIGNQRMEYWLKQGVQLPMFDA